jgi:Holliday junction resolvase RusA-like endonuclease
MAMSASGVGASSKRTTGTSAPVRPVTDLVVWIPGNPQPKQRPRTVNGRTYTPKETIQAEEAIRWHLKAAKAQRVDGPVALEAHFYRKDKRRVDADNLLKTLLDACNKFLFADDSQIVELHVYLERDHDQPGTWLKVSPA